MCATTPSPTLRTADRPNRIALPRSGWTRTEKSEPDSLTSGTSTSMPICRHSLRKTAVWSLLVLTDVSSAAKVAGGKFGLGHGGVVVTVAEADGVRLVNE